MVYGRATTCHIRDYSYHLTAETTQQCPGKLPHRMGTAGIHHTLKSLTTTVMRYQPSSCANDRDVSPTLTLVVKLRGELRNFSTYSAVPPSKLHRATALKPLLFLSEYHSSPTLQEISRETAAASFTINSHRDDNQPVAHDESCCVISTHMPTPWALAVDAHGEREDISIDSVVLLSTLITTTRTSSISAPFTTPIRPHRLLF